MSKLEFRELRIALHVAETGSFRRAARQLDVAPSTLSHAMSALERKLGLRLFHRTTRSVAMTPEGTALLTRIKPLISQLDAVLATPTGDPRVVTGPLRINTPFSAALYLLKKIVPAFIDRHPLVEVELRHEERLVDIVAQGCDAGVRAGRTVPGDMIGVAFGSSLRWVTIASPAYLERYGTPRHPNDLMNHRCIRTRMPSGERYHWEFERGGEPLSLDVPGALTLDRMMLTIEAAASGLGIAYVIEETIESRVASGELEIVLRDWSTDESGYMLYYPGRRFVPPQLKAFVDFIKRRRVA